MAAQASSSSSAGATARPSTLPAASTAAPAAASSSTTGGGSAGTSSSSKGKSKSYPFWLGGASAAAAACITHPVDQTKYRMQVVERPLKMSQALMMFVRRDGVLSLWQGLSASILRQCTYSTARFALYGWLTTAAKQRSSKRGSSTTTGFGTTLACSSLAGGVAGLIGNPAEIVLVRMCADGAKDAKHRYAYPNAISGLYSVAKNEGLKAWYRGVTPNVVRSILMNASQIATYEAAKGFLMRSLSARDGIPLHFGASLIAGTVATTVCAPADVLKSRMQSMASENGVKSPGLVSVFRRSLANEGPVFLFKGWFPAWIRLGPNTVLTFVFLEQLRHAVDVLRENKDKRRRGRHAQDLESHSTAGAHS